MIYKTPSTNGKIRIVFSLPSSFWADTIHLVGDFNNWSTTATPMKLDDKHWNVTLDLDVGKSYEFRYLVNNSDWINDWNADHFTASESGGDNSVITTMLSHEVVSPSELRPNAFTRPMIRQRPSLRIIQGGKQEKQAV